MDKKCNCVDDKDGGSRPKNADKLNNKDDQVVAHAAKDDMLSKETIQINEKGKSILLAINPRLYPQTAVMRASYRFIDDFSVIVDGDPLSTIYVTIKAKPEDTATYEELEDLAHAFFKELIHANVEETQARRYADTRNALIGAALRSMMPSVLAKEKEEKSSDAGAKNKSGKKADTCS